MLSALRSSPGQALLKPPKEPPRRTLVSRLSAFPPPLTKPSPARFDRCRISAQLRAELRSASSLTTITATHFARAVRAAGGILGRPALPAASLSRPVAARTITTSRIGTTKAAAIRATTAVTATYPLTAPRRANSTSSRTFPRGKEPPTEGEPEPARTSANGNMEQQQSDQDYMAFLDRANEDPSKGLVKGQGQGQGRQQTFRARQEGVEVPAPLVRACEKGGTGAFYVSDADEPFEPVALAWDEAGKGLPDEEEFAALIEHWDPVNAEVEILDPADWDRNGQYAEIVDAVREAGQGNDVRVYRVARGGVRVEYWVVTTEGKGKGAKLVGAKALAVES